MKKEKISKNTYKAIFGLWIAILIVALVIYLIQPSQYFTNEKGVKFNKARIYGKLSSCTANNQGTYFTIDDEEKYWFLPIRTSDENFQEFCDDSDIGDIVIKDSYGSILYLIKPSNDTITYKFVKYFEDRKELPNGYSK